MRDHWTIFNLTDQNCKDEICAIMACDIEMSGPVEMRIVNLQLGTKKWAWGDPISEAEFGTYQAFGIKEIKLP